MSYNFQYDFAPHPPYYTPNYVDYPSMNGTSTEDYDMPTPFNNTVGLADSTAGLIHQYPSWNTHKETNFSYQGEYSLNSLCVDPTRLASPPEDSPSPPGSDYSRSVSTDTINASRLSPPTGPARASSFQPPLEGPWQQFDGHCAAQPMYTTDAGHMVYIGPVPDATRPRYIDFPIIISNTGTTSDAGFGAGELATTPSQHYDCATLMRTNETSAFVEHTLSFGGLASWPSMRPQAYDSNQIAAASSYTNEVAYQPGLQPSQAMSQASSRTCQEETSLEQYHHSHSIVNGKSTQEPHSAHEHPDGTSPNQDAAPSFGAIPQDTCTTSVLVDQAMLGDQRFIDESARHLCRICGKWIKYESDLPRHERTHYEREGWVCPGRFWPWDVFGGKKCECPSDGFTRRDTLMRHLRERGPDNPCHVLSLMSGWDPKVRGSITALQVPPV